MLVDSLCQLDLVLDTNVLSHAENAGALSQQSAIALLEWFRESDVNWVLDDQGKAAPDPWTSLLYSEYVSTLAPQGVGLALFVFCLSGGRVGFAPRPDQHLRKQIERLVPRNKQDRAVLGAACGSQNRVLASNDEDDFSIAVRADVQKRLGVRIHTSDELVACA